MKRIAKILVILMLVFALASCSPNLTSTVSTTTGGNNSTASLTTETAAAQPSVISVNYDTEDLGNGTSSTNAATINLDGSTAAIEGSGAEANGSVVTITAAGTYTVNGSLTDGQIIVDTADAETVVIVLNGVNLASSSSAPIYVRNAEKVVLTLANGTENMVTDAASYTLDAGIDEPNSAIFSNADLTITGGGSLTVNANYNNGISSDDSLKITGGTLTVTAVNNGIRGKNYIAVKNASITVNAGGDGLQADNIEDATKGYVLIESGKFQITAAQDGIQAETVLSINGGDFNIVSGGGAANGNSSVRGNGDWGPGTNNTTSDSISTKGLKAGTDLVITGGSFSIDSADDTLHANNSLTISGGDYTLASGDDAMHADSALTIDNGTIQITQSYEGIESKILTFNSGTIHLVSSDDGINGSSGSGGMNASDAAGYFHGSTIFVDANGDGVDINGSIEMTGGTLIINGPTNDGNGALDYTGSFVITGGTLIAAGSSGMAEAPSNNSTQYSMMYNFSSSLPAGTIVHIQSASDEEILTFVPTKTYQSIVYSSPNLVSGTTYTIYTGGSASGTAADGLYSGSTYSGGSEISSLTLSGITTLGGAAGGGPGGFPGGGPGGGGGGHRP